MPDPGFPEFADLKVKPRFNVAPSQRVLIIRNGENGKRELAVASWGFVPSWAKDKKMGFAPINARGDSLVSNKLFCQSFERRRCLVPADGFYEWQGEKPPKQPYFIRMEGDAPFAFGGFWDRHIVGGEAVDTFAIITVGANALMRPIHNRMPFIIEPKDYEWWLDAKTAVAELLARLNPADVVGLEAYKVGVKVGRPQNDSPDLIEPICG